MAVPHYDDAQEVFPSPDARRLPPRHTDVWARIRGQWRPATLIMWLWDVHDPAVLLEWPDPTEPEPVYGVYRFTNAIAYRDSDVPPDQWRTTCTAEQARRLLPPRAGTRPRYRPWPACPGCGAPVDVAYPADAQQTALIVLPCGQRLTITP